MRIVAFFIFISAFITSNDSDAQNLKDFRWKNRIILVFGEVSEKDEVDKQIKELKKDSAGLNDRKILLLQVTQHLVTDQFGIKYKESLYNEALTIQSNADHFEILLIGLDGGIKLRKNQFVSLSELYKLIDVMPMRQAEIRENKN